MAQVVSRQPLMTKAQVCNQVSPCGFVVYKMAVGQAFPQFNPKPQPKPKQSKYGTKQI
jgi:hypothetical protein